MILVDTHALVWLLREPNRLSALVSKTLRTQPLCTSAASLYEIAYKGGRGKWPEVEDYLDTDMVATFGASDIGILPATGAIMQRAGAISWDHRDPFDRIIVATALAHDYPLVSKDDTLDTLGDPAFRRIW